MKTLLLIAIMVMVSGCSALQLDRLSVEGLEGSYGFCAEGSGPPMTGGGVVAAARSGKDFKGSVTVGPDCTVEIVAD